MSNGTHPRHVPRDSGTQPAVHYCTQRLTDDGTVQGCPDWPVCLFPKPPLPPGRAIILRKTVDGMAEVPPATPTPLLRGFVETLFWVACVGGIIGVLWAVLA